MPNSDRIVRRDITVIDSSELGAIVIGEAVRRAKIPKEQVDEVIMGCVLTAGVGQAPARQAALFPKPASSC